MAKEDVKKSLQKDINEEYFLGGALQVLSQHADKNDDEEKKAKAIIGTVSTQYHPHPDLEFYLRSESGWVMGAGNAFKRDDKRRIIKTAKGDLESTLELLENEKLLPITLDNIKPSDEKDEKHSAHREYLEVKNKLVTKEGEINIDAYLVPFTKKDSLTSEFDAYMRTTASKEYKTEDNKTTRKATQIGKRLVENYIGMYQGRFLTHFADGTKKELDRKALVEYAAENLRAYSEEKPEYVKEKDDLIYGIVKVAVQPEKPGEAEE